MVLSNWNKGQLRKATRERESLAAGGQSLSGLCEAGEGGLWEPLREGGRGCSVEKRKRRISRRRDSLQRRS